MTFIEWTSRLEIGVAKIDLQHRTLVGLINKIAALTSEIDSSTHDRVIEVSLNHLIEYTNYHFQTEEELLEEAHYEDLELHKNEHENLRLNMIDLYSRYAKGDDISSELLTFLKAWLENHIIGSDLKYVSSIKKLYPAL